MNADVAVVGCGPAGSAAAIVLARAGRRVVAFERETAAHAKVCGEFVSREACDELLELGVDPFVLGAAAIDRVRVTCGRTSVVARLPFVAASCSRAALDEALLRRALDAGADVRRGTRVVAIEGGQKGAYLRLGGANAAIAEAGPFVAQRVVLASGKSELAGFRRAARANDALGFKTHVALDPRAYDELGSSVELTLFPGGYAGMQRIENGIVAFALVVDRAAYAQLTSWPALLHFIAKGSPRFARRLDALRELWPKPLAVSGVPYGFIFREARAAARAAAEPALYRVGDQLAVIPSFTGDGIAIALVTGSCAARALLRGDSPETFHAAMRRRLARPMRVSGLLARAIRSPLGRAAVVVPARVVPALFTAVAAQTRIPREAAPKDEPQRGVR